MPKTLKKIIFFLFGFLALAGKSEAAVIPHWVSPTGIAAWEDCQSENPLDGAEACHVFTANTRASAGDTVYFRGGIYSFSTLNGSWLSFLNKNGDSSNFITYSSHDGEEVEFKGIYGTRMWGIFIHGSSYIKIKGFIFSDYTDYSIRGSSHHIEVSDCIFRNVTSPYRRGSFQMVEACGGGGGYVCPVSHIWIHHNIFSKLTAGGGCDGTSISEGGDSLRIGYYSITCHTDGTNCAEGLNSNITIENNYLAYGGHTVMDSYSIKSVFRNNVAHNEPWYPADNGNCTVKNQPSYSNANYNNLYSHRVWSFTDTFSRQYSYNLIENNRLGHAGVNPNNDGATALALASPGNIVRYNALYNSMHNNFKYKYGANYGWQASGGINNRVYNNTLYKNGYGYPFFQTCTGADSSTCPKSFYNFRYYSPSDEPGNVAVNNIVYGGYGTVVKNNPDIQPNTSGSIALNNFCTKSNVACSAYGDPKFINPDLNQTTSKILPDLNLQSDSTAINGGTNLTDAVGTGNNSQTLTVKDAFYFQDGSWGSDLANHQADWIAIGTKENIVQLTSIDYGNNKLNLASPKTWNDNDPIWLYKKSDGERVFYGDKPDYGAYEYVFSDSPDAIPPASPQGLRVL